MGKSILVLSLIVLSSILFSTMGVVGIRIRNCASENLCEKIARDPDNSGIHTDCENSERGNDQSLKVCSVNYIYDVLQPGERGVAKNPNKKRCRPIRTLFAIRACRDYWKTRNPFLGYKNGILFKQCYTQAATYLCRYGSSYYITCSVQRAPCLDHCPTLQNQLLIVGTSNEDEVPSSSETPMTSTI